MVDNGLIKAILESNPDNGFIEDGDFLPVDTMELLSKFSLCNNTKILSLFKKNRYAKYSCEVKCPICGEIRVVENLCRTKLLEIVKEIRHYGSGSYSIYKDSTFLFCDKCKLAKEKEDKEIGFKKQQEESKTIQERTSKYIDTYLNPEKRWKDRVKTYQKIRELSQLVDWEEIGEYIKGMGYYDFLSTPYWKAISEKVRYNAGYKCILCNSSTNLNVHHRTYEHHGDELHHLGDLVCICSECHEKHHFE